MPTTRTRPPISWGDLLVALGSLGLGGYFLQGAFAIRVLPSYARVGPRFFPFLVALCLLLCGAVLLLQAVRGERGVPEEAEDADASAPTDWPVLAVLAVALVLDLLLIRPAGFVLASTVLFWGVALGFGDRHLLRTPLIGFVLASLVYLAFTRLLDLTLPAGVLPF